jgi:hypothetical protein
VARSGCPLVPLTYGSVVKFSPTTPIFNTISALFYALHVSLRIPMQERHKGEAIDRDGLGMKVGRWV